ncbi:MAG: cytochrome P450 [Paracoccaceae bacterium]|nr:cytochrome P450 [Paracoccaceae bacterium]
MLRLAEELLLLLIDKEHGDLAPVPAPSLRYALAGAVLMDLALEERIDTDPKHLFVVDSSPVGDGLLDPSLATITGKAGDPRDAAYWVQRLGEAPVADKIRDAAIEQLVGRSILERERGHPLSLSRRVVRARRYPTVDGKAEREVEVRIMGVLFSEEVPSPRDAMLISLVHASGLFERLLSRAEREEVKERLDLFRRLDLIGRAVFQAIGEAGITGAAQADGRIRGVPTSAERARALAALPMAEGGGLPFAGNAFSMTGNIVSFLVRQYRILGPVFRVRAFSRDFTVLAGPRANMLLQRSGKNCFRTLEAFEGVADALGVHRFILSMDGGDHFQLRRALKDGYSHAFILKRAAEVCDIASGFIDEWPKGRPLSVMPAMQRIVGEQIGRICTGVSAKDDLDDLSYYFGRLLAVRAMHRRPELAMKTPRMRRARSRIQGLYERVLEAHAPQRRNDRKPDLIDDVMELHRSDPQLLPEHDLFSACIGPFLAGLHTAASVNALMLYSVLKHPGVLSRVRPEIDSLFANGGPTAEKLRAMDVTHRVAMETLRLYPVAPAALRQAVNTFEFAGYTVPAGTHAIVATTVPHHCPEHYPDPERFDIDRYTPERAEHRKPGVYAPFGMGTHRCLGDRFAEALMVLTLATILHRVHVVMDPPDYRMKIDYSTTTAPDASFRITVVERRS